MKIFALAVALTITAAVFPTNIYSAPHSASSAALTFQVKNLKKPEDVRVQALENVLEKYHSPLKPYAKTYVTMADKYGVDWKLLPSIAGLESTFGRAMIDSTHNAYGWGSGTIYFASWEDGIETINKTLKSNYMDKWGATNVWEIGPIYAESPTWAVRVNGFMNEINTEYLSLTNETDLRPSL